MGYPTYCPTKFALVGLAEVLKNDLIPYNIKISILFAVDADTPDLEKENKHKPEECKIMSEKENLIKTEDIYGVFIEAILRNIFEFLLIRAKLFKKFMKFLLNFVRRNYKEM